SEFRIPHLFFTLLAGILGARLGFALGFGLRVAFRLGAVLRFRVGLGGFLVRVAAIIGLIEAGAPEDDSSTGPNLALRLGLATLWAFPGGLGGDRLELVPRVAAGVADVIVSRHEGDCGFGIADLQRARMAMTLYPSRPLCGRIARRRRDDHRAGTNHAIVH